ncbi:coenzyme Q-binding protein COQ10 homolog, mitochondrial-like [Zingiber officinale]|uniref:coenzyme Q-binding protein COQ10 homolog, mitochondrial-like n=1 Tax=Zingiber officinale TaxID=94328 RepID=UPI001C4C264F|nr:coenzyme Q-binding protein COQ10 homolog, mitochondrial-like [Zingiber officinale]
MPPFLSSSRALALILSTRNRSLDLGAGMRRLGKHPVARRRSERFAQTRSLANIAPCGKPCIGKFFRSGKELDPSVGNLHRYDQGRWFLGCGDGEEGSVLSKIYEERRVIGYSPEQLFAVVAAVDLYEGFVPWCQRSRVIKRNSDGSFDAELEIGFKFLVESYVSHVELEKPKRIKTTASESALFDHLINIWEFNPGPVPGTCDIYFLVDFKFNSPLYRQVASMFFKEVVSRLVTSFTDRCRQIYGPAVQVFEDSYQQSR